MQAYLKKLHPGLRSYDGPGGDGGKDARLVIADGDHVFEVKSFRESLGSSRRKGTQAPYSASVTCSSQVTTWPLTSAS
jgi:hypothetical protein